MFKLPFQGQLRCPYRGDIQSVVSPLRAFITAAPIKGEAEPNAREGVNRQSDR